VLKTSEVQILRLLFLDHELISYRYSSFLLVLLFVLLLGAKAPSSQIGSGYNLARLYLKAQVDTHQLAGSEKVWI